MQNARIVSILVLAMLPMTVSQTELVWTVIAIIAMVTTLLNLGSALGRLYATKLAALPDGTPEPRRWRRVLFLVTGVDAEGDTDLALAASWMWVWQGILYTLMAAGLLYLGIIFDTLPNAPARRVTWQGQSITYVAIAIEIAIAVTALHAFVSRTRLATKLARLLLLHDLDVLDDNSPPRL